MRTRDFDYYLPPHLIAQVPIETRDSSRLLVIHRDTGSTEHRHFHHVIEHLREGDVLVFNNTRVVPARLRASREKTGGKVELLLIRQIGPRVWKALGKPGRSLKPGSRLLLDGAPHNELLIEVLGAEEDGVRTVRVSSADAIEAAGEVALPPYIHTPLEDPERYQTVYSKVPGSVAAPTAGLHFTRELLQALTAKGVQEVYVTLHIELDTFRPIREEDPAEHDIHGEYLELGEDAAAQLNAARHEGRRIMAVGSTSVRVLEQVALWSEARGATQLAPGTGWADLLILPGHRFRIVDAMITNFHLPRSTLLMLVSAFAGRELVLGAYREAIAKEYRFYSFGDAMLVV